jgi:hypothetical protein
MWSHFRFQKEAVLVVGVQMVDVDQWMIKEKKKEKKEKKDEVKEEEEEEAMMAQVMVVGRQGRVVCLQERHCCAKGFLLFKLIDKYRQSFFRFYSLFKM